MTAKLFKYDLKKTTKVLIYMYVISIGVAILARLVSLLDHIQLFFIVTKVLEGTVYAAVVNIMVNTFIHILLNFGKGFYGDESYLTHTLPVGKDKLLLSKYLTALVVIVASVLVCVLSLFIAIYNEQIKLFIEVSLKQVVVGFDMSVGGFVALMVGVLFAQTCANISMAYTAMVKANTYNQKRTLKGVIWFAIYYAITSIVSLVAICVVLAVSGSVSDILAETMSQQSFISILIVGLISYTVSAIVYYFLCQKLFQKGVNVD
jgi:hypothetical protein